jgi:hypothetical protein
MFGTWHYHSLTRKYVQAFGGLFNDIIIKRIDSSNGNVVQELQVPITYGPKEKWYVLLKDDQTQRKYAIKLPRMAFEITGRRFNKEEMIKPINKVAKKLDPSLMKSTFQGLPWILTFELNILAKNQDDICQIWEQIIPYFVPNFVQTIKIIPDFIELDIPTELKTGDILDIYDDSFLERRVLSAKMTFDMKCWFFGPVSNQGIIKRTQVDFFAVSGSGPVTNADVARTPRVERYTIQPGLTANGTPTSNSSISIPYQQIDADDDYGFVENTYTFDDHKKFDPISGTDKDIP